MCGLHTWLFVKLFFSCTVLLALLGVLDEAVPTGAVQLFLSFMSLRNGDALRFHRIDASLSFISLRIGQMRTSAWNNLQVGRTRGVRRLQETYRNSHRFKGTRLSAAL